MSLNGLQFTTSIGEAKLAAALMGAGPQVQITHVALGDGNGARYEPFAEQTQLRRELARNAITRQHMSDDRTWRVVAEFDTETPAFWLREVGFLDADGDLIFIVAGTEFSEGYTGAFDLLFEGFLDLRSTAEGLVIVKAPDDELFRLAVSTARFQAITAKNLVQQARQIKALEAKG